VACLVIPANLLLENVTALWKQAEAEATRCDSQQQQHTLKCPFSWVSGLSLQQNNQTWVQEYFQQRASEWEGWELANDGGKVGFVPTKSVGSHMTLDFSFSETIRTVTVFIMKSYGDNWANSAIRVKTSKSKGQNQWLELNSKDIVGFHNKNTSEMYTEEIYLPEPIVRGESLRLRAQLTGGKTFKLMGLAVCS
jgi:hypothetical protein